MRTLLLAVVCMVTSASNAQATYTLQQAVETACASNADLSVKRLNAMAAKEQKRSCTQSISPTYQPLLHTSSEMQA